MNTLHLECTPVGYYMIKLNAVAATFSYPDDRPLGLEFPSF